MTHILWWSRRRNVMHRLSPWICLRWLIAYRVAQLYQVYGLSSIQLSPNRGCEDYAYNILDVFPVFQVSPDAEGYFPDMSPVTPTDLRNLPKAPYTLAHGSLPPEATGSLDSFIGSPVTSMSLTEDAADLSLLPNPLILLLDEMLLLTR